MAAVYSIVLFADICMILFLRGVGKDIRKGRYGADMPAAHKKTIAKQWQTVEGHLSSHLENDWKIALLEADRIVNQVLDISGLKGENFREKVENANSNQIEQREDLLRAHEVRNAIIRDHGYVLSSEQAQETIEIFKTFLNHWEAL